MEDIALVAPLAVSCMEVDPSTILAQPVADFSRLPFNDGHRDINPGRPFLADETVSRPFEDASAWLPPGLHLHWRLPWPLTRGRDRYSSPNPPEPWEATVAGLDFPLIPNRWLVQTPSDIWVVESDYVHPDGNPYTNDGVSYLLTDEQQHRLNSRAPVRFVGRQVRFRDWNPYDPDAQYLGDITAVGWGHHAFHGFYPNCWSVLGFHDPDYQPGGDSPLTYSVYGGYADTTQDPLAGFIAESRPTVATDYEMGEQIRQRFGWSTMGTEEFPWRLPNRLLLAGRAMVDPDSHPGSAPKPAVQQIRVGATGGEALAAYLSSQLAQGTIEGEPTFEELVESVLLADRVDHRRPDAVAKLKEARHDKEFVATPAGSSWTVRAFSVGPAAQAEHAPSADHGSPPAAAMSALVELNRLQRERDRLERQEGTVRAQLYSDWCKYQLCKYPAGGKPGDHPDPADVRRHIERHSLAKLEVTISRYRRISSELIDAAIAIGHLLAKEDRDALRVRAEEVTDWEGILAMAATLGVSSSMTATELSTDIDEQHRLVEALNQLAENSDLGQTLRSRAAEKAGPAFAAWLGEPAGHWSHVDTDHVRDVLIGRYAGADSDWERRWLDHRNDNQALDEAIKVRACLEVLADGALPVVAKTRHELDARPGPRFWQPRDPVLLLADDGSSLDHSRQKRRNDVYCALLPCAPEPMQWLRGLLEAAGPDRPQAEHPVLWELERTTWAKVDEGKNQDSVPILADWKVALHHPPVGRPAETAGTGLHEMLSEYELSGDGPDLVHRYQWAPIWRKNSPTIFSGRSTLSSHVGPELLDAIERNVDPEGDEHELIQEMARVRDFLTPENEWTPAAPSMLTLSLTGLGASMLQHETLIPMPVRDPLAFPEAEAFAARVAAAVGFDTTLTPQPMKDFLPLRAGDLEVLELRLIDSFGRVSSVGGDPANPLSEIVRGSETMPDHELGQSGTRRTALRPRLVPPTRLDFRWLATGTEDQSHDHPDTGPICGWMVPNVLENQLMVHDSSGKPVGSIDQAGRWWPPPGNHTYIAPHAIEDPGLRGLVVHLLHRSEHERLYFLYLAMSSLEAIAPEARRRHRSLALLMGRPMAVVRSQVRLELLGHPPQNQSWASFERMLAGGPPDDGGLTNVRFPLRIGEHGQLDDGVVGFWVEDEPGSLRETFHSPQLRGEDTTGLDLRLDDEPLRLTMLVDPRGKVYATTGIVPTKVIDIPDEQYATALDNIDVTFFTAPILTHPDRLEVAVPNELDYEWSWLERQPDGWRRTSSEDLVAPNPAALLDATYELRDGWLVLSSSHPSRSDGADEGEEEPDS